MNIIPSLKRSWSKHPFAVTATAILVALVITILTVVVVAIYKDAIGVVCTGLFGVQRPCVDAIQIGLTVIDILWVSPIGRLAVISVVILYIIELIRVAVAKSKS